MLSLSFAVPALATRSVSTQVSFSNQYDILLCSKCGKDIHRVDSFGNRLSSESQLAKALGLTLCIQCWQDILNGSDRSDVLPTIVRLDEAGKVPATQLGGTDPKGDFFLKSDRTWATVSVTETDPVVKALTGIITSNGSTISAITDSHTSWDAGYTYRLTSASGTSPLTLTLNSNGLTGSVDLSSKLGTGLTSAHIFVGNGSTVATDVAASGDVSLVNTGAFTVTGIQSKGITLAAGFLNYTGSAWQFSSVMTNPMTTLGDIIYENDTPAPARLAGNTSTTKNFLTSTGSGGVAQAPAWGTIADGDLPATLANKTLTTPVIATFYQAGGGGLITIPANASPQTVATLQATQAFGSGSTWNGGLIVGQYGGTGVANTSKTITLGGNLATSGAYNLTMTLGATTNLTLPALATVYVPNNPMTTIGDLIYANSTATPSTTAALAAAAVGQVLISKGTGTAPAWSSAPVVTSLNGLIVTTTLGTLTIPNNASAKLITSGNFSITLTATAATSVTLPLTGTLTTLDNAEIFTNKTLTTPVIATLYQDAGKTKLITLPAIVGTLETQANKGAISGYAGLDAGSKVPTVNLGGSGASASTYLRGDQTWVTPPGGGESENIARAPGDVTNATISFADITGMTFTPLANKTYIFEAWIVFQSNTASCGIKFAGNGPASPTAYVMNAEIPIGPTLYASDSLMASRAYDTGTPSVSVDTINSNLLAKIDGVLVNGANSTAFTLRFAAETTGTVKVLAGSVLRYRQVN